MMRDDIDLTTLPLSVAELRAEADRWRAEGQRGLAALYDAESNRRVAARAAAAARRRRARAAAARADVAWRAAWRAPPDMAADAWKEAARAMRAWAEASARAAKHRAG